MPRIRTALPVPEQPMYDDMGARIYLSSGRNNIGMKSEPNSLIAQGDFPTELETVEIRPHSLPDTSNPEGSLYDGVAFEQDMYNSGSTHHDNFRSY